MAMLGTERAISAKNKLSRANIHAAVLMYADVALNCKKLLSKKAHLFA
jgi:hypothetical protein